MTGYVYLLVSKKDGTLYTGVTPRPRPAGFRAQANAQSRVHQQIRGRATRLVLGEAIVAEKRIKKWRRTWKLELIERHNRQWRDLYEELA